MVSKDLTEERGNDIVLIHKDTFMFSDTIAHNELSTICMFNVGFITYLIHAFRKTYN